jgi:predicted transcriptional regulator
MKKREVTEMNETRTLDHPTRRLLYQFITENPGASFQFILKILKIPEGTLRYHLQHLQRSNRIVKEKKGKNLCYYSKFRRDNPECHLDAKLNSRQELLLGLIRNEPGINRKELMIRAKSSRRSLNYDLRRLRDLRLVMKVETGDGKGYEALSKDRLKDEMFKILVDRMLKGELTLEKFKLLKERLEDL